MSITEVKQANILLEGETEEEIEELEEDESVEEDEVLGYYDFQHPEEDWRPDNPAQFNLVRYLVDLLRWLYRNETCYIIGDLQINKGKNRAITPDISVFKGVSLTSKEERKMRSWRIRGVKRPAPTVVFEIMSHDTWQIDVYDKPYNYQSLGAREYFVYDPSENGYWYDGAPRIHAWRLSKNSVQKLPESEEGWIWSEELASWLVPDGEMLRLYDANKQLRLNKADQIELEAEQKIREAEQKLEALRTKLREQGIDPDSLV